MYVFRQLKEPLTIHEHYTFSLKIIRYVFYGMLVAMETDKVHIVENDFPTLQ